MSQLMMFLLGLIVGIVIGVLGTNLWRVSSTRFKIDQEFATLEDTFEQFMEELDQKYQKIVEEIAEREAKLYTLYNNIQSKTEKMSQDKRAVSNQPKNRKTKSSTSKIQNIKALLAEGQIPESVAKQLGIGKGEVELLLRLENMQNSD